MLCIPPYSLGSPARIIRGGGQHIYHQGVEGLKLRLTVIILILILASYGTIDSSCYSNDREELASSPLNEAIMESAQEMPELVLFSTIIDGSSGGYWDEYTASVAVDNQGYVYLTGSTVSDDFPLKSPLDDTLGGDRDCFVAKLTPDGSQLVYSTYIGGSNNDQGYSIDVDSAGNAYVTGVTYSPDFPVVSAYDSTYNASGDCFVIKINSDGSNIVYSTYLGGAGFEEGRSLKVDSTGHAFITGAVESPGFGVDTLFHPWGEEDGCFVVKFSQNGAALEYSMVISGGGQDIVGRGIAIDEDGNAYVTGRTRWGSSWPMVNAFQETFGGPETEGFVFKLNATGDGLIFSTFLGGNWADEPYCITIDDEHNVYVAGETSSSDFPLENPIINSTGYHINAFVSKLNSTGNGLVFSTLLGGADIDISFAIAVNDMQEAYISGHAGSSDFQKLNQLDLGNEEWPDSGFVMKLNASGTGILFSTLFAGDTTSSIYAMDLDTSGNIVFGGVVITSSYYSFPNTTVFSPGEYSRGCFVAKIRDLTDRDFDSLYDFHEDILGSDKNNYDSDFDLMPDGYEYFNGLNLLSNDAQGDLDLDELTNLQEYYAGTDPRDSDSDDDTLSDYAEVMVYGTNPLSNDTDQDLMPDAYEVANGLNPTVRDGQDDADGDTLSNKEEYDLGTNPQSADTDNDTLSDADEVNLYGTNPLLADTDGDSLDDAAELAIGTNPLVPELPLVHFFVAYPLALPILLISVLLVGLFLARNAIISAAKKKKKTRDLMKDLPKRRKARTPSWIPQRHRDMVQRASLMHQRESWQEAERLYREYLEMDPDNIDALFGLATLLYQTGRPSEAEEIHGKAYSLNPDHPDILVNYAAMLAGRGMSLHAEALLRKALSLRREDTMAWNNLGAVLLQLDKAEEAESAYQTALSFDPRNAAAFGGLSEVYRRQEKMEEAGIMQSKYEEYLGQTPSEPHILAEATTDRERDVQPRILEQKPIEESSDARRTFAQAIRYEEAGNLIEAEKYYLRTLNLDPDFHEAWTNFGAFLLDQGRAMAAVRYLKATLDRQQDNPIAWQNLGIAHKAMGEDQEAIRAFQTALQHRPDYDKALRHLGLVYARNGDYDNAISVFQKLVKINPSEASDWDYLGVVLAKRIKYEDAIKAFSKAVEADSKYAPSWYNLGMVMRNMGSTGWEDKIAKSVSLDPSLKQVYASNKPLLDDICIMPETKAELEFRPVPPDESLRLAQSLIANRNYNDAYMMLLGTISQRKDMAEAWKDLAGVAELLGKPEVARGAREGYLCVSTGKPIPDEVWDMIGIKPAN